MSNPGCQIGQLPEHRRVINGRTHAQSWCASDFDPVYRATRRRSGRAVQALRSLAFFGAMAAIGVILAWRG